MGSAVDEIPKEIKRQIKNLHEVNYVRDSVVCREVWRALVRILKDCFCSAL